METKLISQSLDHAEADAIAVVVGEQEGPPAELEQCTAWFEELRTSGEFTGKSGEIAVLHRPPGLAAKRLVLAGAGKKQDFDGAALRRAVASTVRALKQKGVKISNPTSIRPPPKRANRWTVFN